MGELRQAVAGFVDRYNRSRLIQRHGHRTPKEAYQHNQPQRHNQTDTNLSKEPAAVQEHAAKC